VPRYYLLSHFPVETATRASMLLIPSSNPMSSGEDNNLAVGRCTFITAVMVWMYVAIVLEFVRLNCSLVPQPPDTAWYLGHTDEATNRRYHSITVSRMWLCQNLCSLLVLEYWRDHCNTQATKCSTQYRGAGLTSVVLVFLDFCMHTSN
jgi:hypothetical protein